MHRVGETVALHGEDARKLRVVLRAKHGDAVEICDSSGHAYLGRVAFEGATLGVELIEARDRAGETRTPITLAQAVPKGAKMDFVVEKATELGIIRIVPVRTERTIGEASAAKLDRWRRLARSAAAQSARRHVPEVANALPLDALLAGLEPGSALIVPWELAERVPLRDGLKAVPRNGTPLVLLIGPEGGFSHDEIERVQGAGAVVVSLGTRILRTETAGLVVLSALLYEFEEL